MKVNPFMCNLVRHPPVHGHDESGRAESALGAVVADEAGLDLVEVVGRPHALHSRDRPSVALQKGRYALQKKTYATSHVNV